MEKKQKKVEGLPRQYEWGRDRTHKKCYGNIMVLYVFKRRRWLKIGEYCTRCGAVALFDKFKKGLPGELY